MKNSERFRDQNEGISRLVVEEALSKLSYKHIDMVTKAMDGKLMGEEDRNWYFYLTDMPEISVQDLEEALQG